MMLLPNLYAALAALAALPSGTLAASTKSAAKCAAGNALDLAYSADEVIAKLQLKEIVQEKGFFTQTFEDAARVDGRSASTAIYYLLPGSEGQSVWHVLDAAEVWHYYAGAPLALWQSDNDGRACRKTVLGPNIFDGQAPQAVVPQGTWQSARSLGNWTLVGTTVAPGFLVKGAQFADKNWKPANCC